MRGDGTGFISHNTTLPTADLKRSNEGHARFNELIRFSEVLFE